MKKFLQNMSVILTALGLTAKFQNKELTAEEQASIVDAYNKQFGEDAFDNDHKVFEDEKKKAADAAALSETFGALAAELGVKNDNSEDTAAATLQAVKDLKAEVSRLGNQAGAEKPEETVTTTITVAGVHTKDFAFGVRHKMFAAGLRWNRIAMTRKIEGEATAAEKQNFHETFTSYAESLQGRMQELAEAGLLKGLKPQSAITVSGLNSDNEIGLRQFTIRQDALIARIIALPSLDRVFPKVSNVQSGQVITNVLFSEISQAYQSGHVFKGAVSFEPEKAKVDKVMAKVQFTDMSALELSYLNYLNTSGSDPVKWNMIEWFILHIATKIANEKLLRGIQGYYHAPTANTPGHFMHAADGLLKKLFDYNRALKMKAFTDNDCDGYTSSTIGDVLIYFVSKIAGVREDWADFEVCVNEAHRPWFIHWYETKYGQFNNFDGAKTDRVPEYGNAIKWVPGMGKSQIIFASLPGNIQLLENVPGEEYRMQFQRDLEEVIAFSYWKEGVGAGFVGKAIAAASWSAYDGAEQVIFMNWPATAVAADATSLTAGGDNIFQLPNTNTANKALTDIVGAKDGEVYRILAPATAGTYKTTIAKSGKFANLTAAVDFSSCAWIDLAYDSANSVFIELGRAS